MKPPFAYYGGKTTLAPKIASLLPPHEHYVEPFAGSLAVLLAKKPSKAETVNDLDGDLMTFWRVLRDRPDEFERACALTPHSRAELARSVDLDVADDLERARRVFVRLTQSRAHSMRANAGWINTKKLGTQPLADKTLAQSKRIGPAAQRLRLVTLEARDALDVIRDYGTEPTVCLYVDPPYLGETRATNYRVELTGHEAHRDLAAALHGCKATVVLSGYDSPLYADLFGDWHRMDLPGATTLRGDTDRVEVLWSNAELHDQPTLDLDVTA